MDYVHGYSAEEGSRLTDQATTLTGLLQRQAGGDSLIGRQLYPLLVQAGTSHTPGAPGW